MLWFSSVEYPLWGATAARRYSDGLDLLLCDLGVNDNTEEGMWLHILVTKKVAKEPDYISCKNWTAFWHHKSVLFKIHSASLQKCVEQCFFSVWIVQPKSQSVGVAGVFFLAEGMLYQHGPTWKRCWVRKGRGREWSLERELCRLPGFFSTIDSW